MTPYVVGQTLPKLVKPPITKTQLVKYSGASGDFNPIHTVEEFAVSAGLGGVIAHGMLTMAFVGQMMTDTIGLTGPLQQFSVRFQEMVRPGDVVTCEGKIIQVEEAHGEQIVYCEIWAMTAPERVVVAGKATFSVPLESNAVQGESNPVQNER